MDADNNAQEGLHKNIKSLFLSIHQVIYNSQKLSILDTKFEETYDNILCLVSKHFSTLLPQSDPFNDFFFDIEGNFII